MKFSPYIRGQLPWFHLLTGISTDFENKLVKYTKYPNALEKLTDEAKDNFHMGILNMIQATSYRYVVPLDPRDDDQCHTIIQGINHFDKAIILGYNELDVLQYKAKLLSLLPTVYNKQETITNLYCKIIHEEKNTLPPIDIAGAYFYLLNFHKSADLYNNCSLYCYKALAKDPKIDIITQLSWYFQGGDKLILAKVLRKTLERFPESAEFWKSAGLFFQDNSQRTDSAKKQISHRIFALDFTLETAKFLELSELTKPIYALSSIATLDRQSKFIHFHALLHTSEEPINRPLIASIISILDPLFLPRNRIRNFKAFMHSCRGNFTFIDTKGELQTLPNEMIMAIMSWVCGSDSSAMALLQEVLPTPDITNSQLALVRSVTSLEK